VLLREACLLASSARRACSLLGLACFFREAGLLGLARPSVTSSGGVPARLLGEACLLGLGGPACFFRGRACLGFLGRRACSASAAGVLLRLACLSASRRGVPAAASCGLACFFGEACLFGFLGLACFLGEACLFGFLGWRASSASVPARPRRPSVLPRRGVPCIGLGVLGRCRLGRACGSRLRRGAVRFFWPGALLGLACLRGLGLGRQSSGLRPRAARTSSRSTTSAT
jgi:hypothetical protein